MQAVGSVGYLPMSNIGIGDDFEIVGRPPVAPDGDRPTSWISTVGGRYFEAMRIRLIRGRFPRNLDTEKTQAVFVIDEDLARKYWAGQDPIGARLIWREKGEVKLAGEVIGIVGGVRWAGRANSAQPTAYFWFPQDPGREINIAARAEGDPTRLAALIATQVREIDPNQPLGEVRAMEDADLARPRFTMLLLSAFASAAMLLAAIGLCGVIAFWVTQRTREIGVRVALGAEYRDVLTLVMWRGVVLIGTGIDAGIGTCCLGLAVRNQADGSAYSRDGCTRAGRRCARRHVRSRTPGREARPDSGASIWIDHGVASTMIAACLPDPVRNRWAGFD